MRRLVIFGTTLIGVIGVAILSPAFPEIKKALALTDFQVAMLITAFTLPGIFLSPLMGVLADRFGRRVVLVPSLLLFGLSGFACAFVDYETMVVLRFLQGVGGSALTSLAVTLIGDFYNGLERTKMLGYNASLLSVGLAIYPLLGGFLAEIDWRLVFCIFIVAVPIGLVALTIDIPPKKTDMQTYARKVIRILLDRGVILGFLSGCTVFVITYGAFLLYIPILLARFGATPLLRGVVMSSTLFLTALVASKLDFFVKNLGLFGVIRLGFISYTLSLALIPLAPNLFYLTAFVSLYGLGHGTVLPALQNFVVNQTTAESRAVVMTTYNSMIRIGQTVGPVFASTFAYYSTTTVFVASAILSLFLALIIPRASRQP
jgi:MFS family permease